MLTLESTLKFGKHKGEQLEDVIEDDPSYIEWLVNETDVELDEETMELITKKGIA